MKACHDSRMPEYRRPYGAVAPGTAVTLTLDVWEAPDAVVTLRTWIDGIGEQRFPMTVTQLGLEGTPARYGATITPDKAGIVWYHFIIRRSDGTEKRYGAQSGERGGVGELYDWEPPSFQLTVHEAGIMPPAWHQYVMGYLQDDAANHSLTDIVETVRENFPEAAYQDALPWTADAPADQPGALIDAEGLCPAFDGAPSPVFDVNGDVFGFWRVDDANNAICVLVNTALHASYNAPVPLADEEVTDLIGGYGIDIVKSAQTNMRYARVRLGPLAAAALHFHKRRQLQRTMEPGVGVLAHITSLPAEGKATLGAPAHAFVDWLAQANVRYWQVLPASPTDEYGSPYAGISAFAGNALLLSPDYLNDGFDTDEYRAFCKREADWLEPYACFMAIRDKVGAGVVWQDWPRKYRSYDPALLNNAELKEAAEAWRRSQYAFERQWSDLRSYANKNGVLIIGDMPLYVSADSADVWSQPELFQLDPDGHPRVVAGCPPDPFAEEGQIWGNPVYDWDACAADGYAWWLRRLERAFQLYDFVRLDHFIGFSRYYRIPADGKAKDGSYCPGPGIDFFYKAFKAFGPLPLIAEDLGLITPAVRALAASCGFPGMDVEQFADGNDPLSGYSPRPGKIAYTGTHDNQTLAGYCAQRYPDEDEQDVLQELREAVATCQSDVCVFPLQDLIGLDDEARMNVPGVAEGNWAWQADAADMDKAQEVARQLVALHEESREPRESSGR